MFPLPSAQSAEVHGCVKVVTKEFSVPFLPRKPEGFSVRVEMSKNNTGHGDSYHRDNHISVRVPQTGGQVYRDVAIWPSGLKRHQDRESTELLSAQSLFREALISV